MAVTLAFIGAGNMGGALMRAAAAGGASVGASDGDPRKAADLAAAVGGKAYASNAEAARDCRFLVIAVKPQVLAEVLSDLAPVLRELDAAGRAPVLVSVAAGASIAKLRSLLEGPAASGAAPAFASYPIVRLMPNTPALVARGVIALSAGPAVAEDRIAELEKGLAAAGIVDRVEEKLMDAVTALSGSGPAFAYLFIEALADAGVRAGLPRDKALSYAARTVGGAAAMVEQTGRHPAQLKDEVCSPGGTTIAGVAALEDRGFRAAALAAVDAAFRRAKEL